MSGPNRQAKQERQQRAHRTVKGAPVPDGRHKETRKERDRRRNEKVRRAGKGRG